MRSLLGLRGLDHGSIVGLLERARVFESMARDEAIEIARGRVVANLFLEDSTRTRASFAAAAMRLGATTIDLAGSGSSTSKGETLGDTARTLESAGADAIVVRVKPAGASALVSGSVGVPVVNAGDGRHEHPTQGLLDAFALASALGRESFDLSGLRVAIVGDVANSRVARSDVAAMTSLGADVMLVGPRAFVPAALGVSARVTVSRDLDAVLPDVDAVQVLRVQFERHGDRGAGLGFSRGAYRRRFGLTEARAAGMRPGALVMHPGPANRGLEIDSAVHDGERSVVRAQVRAGLLVRMAVLERCLTGSD